MKKRTLKILEYEELWILLWAIFFGLFVYAQINGISYTTEPLAVSVYFASVSAILLLAFKKNFMRVPHEFNLFAFLAFLGSILFSFLLYWWLNSNYEIPTGALEFLNTTTSADFLWANFAYLIPKLFELVFQQTLVVLLVSFLAYKFNMPMKRVILIFVLLFGLTHIPVLLSEGLLGAYYFIPSLVGAALFPYLIMKHESGFLYSYSLHLLYYSLSGPLWWFFIF